MQHKTEYVAQNQTGGGRGIKLHLHIGTEKTGTTSFQRWLEKNQAELAGNAVIFPKLPRLFPNDISQRLLSMFAQGFSPKDDGFQYAGILDEEKYARVCEVYAKHFAAEVKRTAGQGDWIISGEHLHSRLLDPAQVKRLQKFLAGFFDEIIVYIHLRPQVDVLCSAASTVARVGGRVSVKWFEDVGENKGYYNYEMLVARWGDEFGAAQLRIIPYKRQPSIRNYFLRELGLPASRFSPPQRLNERLDWRTIAMLNAIQPYRKEIFGGQKLPSVIDALPFTEALQIGLSLARDITQKFQMANERLIREREELQDGDLTPDWADYDHKENLSLINEGVISPAQLALWITQTEIELYAERCRTKLAETERALMRKKFENARMFLHNAQELIAAIETMDPAFPSLASFGKRAEKLALELASKTGPA
ncbi:MAG: hypothetical protein L3J37_02225 [Rhodobacteraceae bacterium]|nr:hypothetical protein [Paracoccaceae bacterium]